MKSKPHQSHHPPSSSSYPFHFAVTRTAVAQICRSVGFKSSQNSALSALTDIAIRYLQSLAVSSANSTARTQSNLLDVVFALEYLHSLKGFSGGSNLSRKYYESGPLFDVFDFMCSSDEIPFAKPVEFRRESEKLGRAHLTPSRKDEIVRSLTPADNAAGSTTQIINVVVKKAQIISSATESEKGEIVRSLTSTQRGKDGRSYIPRWLPDIPVIGGGNEGEGMELGIEGNGGIVVEEKKEWGMLPMKRGKVRFKMGLSGVLKSGVCRGGKRVLVQMSKGDDENDDDDEKEEIKLKKKKRESGGASCSSKKR